MRAATRVLEALQLSHEASSPASGAALCEAAADAVVEMARAEVEEAVETAATAGVRVEGVAARSADTAGPEGLSQPGGLWGVAGLGTGGGAARMHGPALTQAKAHGAGGQPRLPPAAQVSASHVQGSTRAGVPSGTTLGACAADGAAGQAQGPLGDPPSQTHHVHSGTRSQHHHHRHKHHPSSPSSKGGASSASAAQGGGFWSKGGSEGAPVLTREQNARAMLHRYGLLNSGSFSLQASDLLKTLPNTASCCALHPTRAPPPPPALRLQRGLSELLPLSAADTAMARAETIVRLKHVLETYTDVTRYPVPRRPDAAVFVAATDDG